MLCFRYPFSDQIFTTEENSNSNLVRFVSFNNSEQVDFKGDIKEISLNQFLEDEVFSDVSLSELIDFEEETESDSIVDE